LAESAAALSPEARTSLALALEALEGHWEAWHLDQAYRLARDPARSVWEPVCRALGSRAGRQEEVLAALEDLLFSPVREIRQRGIVALARAAPLKPAEVAGFVAARLEEMRRHPDPVLLDSLLAVVAALPAGQGAALAQSCLTDDSESLRAAAAARLGRLGLPLESWLVRLAADPSPLVQAALVETLAALEPSPAVVEAWSLLAASADPRVRERVAEELPRTRSELAPLLLRLLGDADEAVRLAAARGPLSPSCPAAASDPAPGELPSPDTVRAVEEHLEAHPSQVYAHLRLLLEREDAPGLLRMLAEMAGDRSLASLCRAIHSLLWWGEPDRRRWLLRSIGILADQPADSPAGAFRAFLELCLAGVEVRGLEDIQSWAARASTSCLDLLDPASREVLEQLVLVGQAAGEVGLLELSGVAGGLVSVCEGCPAPEGQVLEAVAEVWTRLISARLQQLLEGSAP
jgi:hypothetical protein